jgi:cation:H+ antiporter
MGNLLISPLIAVIALAAGLWLMIFSSKKAIDHSIIVATAFNIPPLVIGVVLVAFGTDLPEIVNSVVSSYLGHADINIGDSMGSVLSQMTLVFGILPFVGELIRLKRREILVIGSCLILSLVFLYVIFDKGSFTRVDALFMILSLGLFTTIISSSVAKEDFEVPKKEISNQKWLHLLFVLISLIGVGLGSYFVVESIITLAQEIRIPEYFISFFIVGIGTSLPELIVDITAIRKKQFNIAIGDILGSCLVDATLSIGIGQFLFPQPVSADLASETILYIMVVAVLVTTILAIRRKLDRKMGVFLILMYLLSYIFLFV